MKRAGVIALFGMSAAAVACIAWAASAQEGAVKAPPAPVNPAPRTAAMPAAPPVPAAPTGPMTLMLRGLDKITGRPTDITAPIGKPVHFATLTITARYCYSTPASETPETAAFLQIKDDRPDQSERRIFSGWMYASSPGLNAVEHPLYDVWVITCRGGNGAAPPTVASAAPAKVLSPDSSDKEGITALPEGAGQ
jgi:hypothetical protein